MPLRVTPEAFGHQPTGGARPQNPADEAETIDEVDHIETTSDPALPNDSVTGSPRSPAGTTPRPPAETLRSFDDVVRLAARDLQARPGGTGGVGIEMEWFVIDVARPQRSVPPEETAAALTEALGTAGSADTPGAPGVNGTPRTDGTDSADGTQRADGTDGASALPRLPGGSRLTFEPGGQLELSGPPLPLTQAVAAMRGDLSVVRGALARRRLGLAGLGVDPLRPPRRHSTASRYLAMDEHFRTVGGEAGLTMMCSTASVQVNLDSGSDDEDVAARFQLAHALEPVLIAMFAASPLAAGRALAWQSGRQAVWAGIEASRTRPVLPGPGPAPADQLAGLWARYLCDAQLMMVAHDDGRYQSVQEPATFGAWLAGGGAGAGPVTRPPTGADLGWHATTLFPPVRPRGWLELRYLDAQPSELWPVAVAVPSMLLNDPQAGREALAACRPVAGQGHVAAEVGLGDPALFRAAVRCVDLAVEALTRAGDDPDLRAAVEGFAQRYTRRRRSPADDLTARFEARGPAELLREEVTQCLLVP